MVKDDGFELGASACKSPSQRMESKMLDEKRGKSAWIENPPAPGEIRAQAVVPSTAPVDVDILSKEALVCLQDFCFDRDSLCWRAFATVSHLAAFTGSLTLSVLLAYVLFPFEKAELGFWNNWMFNLVAHPVANYIVARGVLVLFARPVLWDLEQRLSLCKQRQEITRRIQIAVLWVPMVDSLWCVGEHVIASFANIYPIPFSGPLSCIPATFASLGIFCLVLPREIRALPSTRSYLKFAICSWAVYCAFFTLMLFYVVVFPLMETWVQFATNLLVTLVMHGVVALTLHLGKLHWSVPFHFRREMKTCMKLPVIVFKASMLSDAKGIWVLLSMLLPEVLDVAKGLVEAYVDVAGTHRHWANIRSMSQVVQASRRTRQEFRDFRKRLREIAQLCEMLTKEELEGLVWGKEDIHLLNQISKSLWAVLMLEVCEVMAPAIYITLLLCLQSGTFLGHNSSFFLGLADANLHESMIANGYSLAVEATMLVATDLCTRATMGISVWMIIRSVLRCDFSFWLSIFAMVYVGWLTMLVEHSGHDLAFDWSRGA